MISVDPNHTQSAYGGSGWQPRTHSLRGELGHIWSACGIDSEYQRLTHVLLHRPGTELEASANPDVVNMLEPLDLARAQAQHDALADVYRTYGITVTYADPASTPTPNQMFMADVFVMTPEGAIVARPASQVRAGEERVAARRLSDMGVPILRSINNRGTFEGADLMWLDPQTAIVGRGLRTNDEGASQIEQLLTSMGIGTIKVDLPFGSMHLMGMLRIVDRNLAIIWPSRFVHRGVDALRERGFHVAMLPENEEVRRGAAFNFVTIAPRTIVMAAGNPRTQAWFEQHGITCITTPVDELAKAAGAIGCLTGIVSREM
ncbi:MAG: dimethylarginine dimethylaminohydrolase family protein [Roseiflexaceae bacterium]|jgi:arginine deiminase|nr:arginine deiminase family protein [Chloroflexaceae bacterium]